jgi:hypothetical protein
LSRLLIEIMALSLGGAHGQVPLSAPVPGVWLMINGFACLVLSLTGLLLSQHKNRVSNIAFPVLFRGVAYAVALGNGRKAARASRRSVIVGGW